MRYSECWEPNWDRSFFNEKTLKNWLNQRSLPLWSFWLPDRVGAQKQASMHDKRLFNPSILMLCKEQCPGAVKRGLTVRRPHRFLRWITNEKTRWIFLGSLEAQVPPLMVTTKALCNHWNPRKLFTRFLFLVVDIFLSFMLRRIHYLCWKTAALLCSCNGNVILYLRFNIIVSTFVFKWKFTKIKISFFFGPIASVKQYAVFWLVLTKNKW